MAKKSTTHGRVEGPVVFQISNDRLRKLLKKDCAVSDSRVCNLTGALTDKGHYTFVAITRLIISGEDLESFLKSVPKKIKAFDDADLTHD